MEALESLVHLLATTEAGLSTEWGRARRAVALILLVQYLNALRISEAVECIGRYLVEGRRDIVIQSRKHGNPRVCTVPELGATDKIILSLYYKKHGFDLHRVTQNARRLASYHGIRSHDLRRLALWRMHTEDSIPARELAVITGHRDARTVTRYYLNPLFSKLLYGVGNA